jgi:enoyl-CoA hydratase/carnithine racemase
MSQEHIISHEEGGVLTLTINRPAKKNALTLAMYDALTQGLNEGAERGSVRVVVIKGVEGVFTSGNDLKDFSQNPPKGTDTPVFHFLKALVDFPKPLVAAVDGVAVGIGTTLLLHCDFVYASERARFALPFGKLGLVPEGGSSYLLPLMMGQRKAAELLLVGEAFGAVEAERLGLVNTVYPTEELEAQLNDKLNAIVALPPEATRLSKALIKAPFKEELERVMMKEGEVFIGRLGSPENMEAFSAFFERRAPDFSRFS